MIHDSLKVSELELKSKHASLVILLLLWPENLSSLFDHFSAFDKFVEGCSYLVDNMNSIHSPIEISIINLYLTTHALRNDVCA